MNRRKIRRYRGHRGNSGVKFLGILGIMMVAVICGYLTARFVIAPLMGYDTEVLKMDFPSNFLDVFNQDDDTDDDANDDAGDNTSTASEEKPTDDSEAEEDDSDDAEASNSDEDSGYALQFGLFSTKSRAEELQDKLEDEGIDAEIKKIDGKYKVISPLVDTKDEALETLKNTESKHVDDIFITKI